MRNDSLKLSFASSLLLHVIVLALASAFVQNSLRRQEFQPIVLVDLPPAVPPVPVKKAELDVDTKKPLLTKTAKITETKAAAQPQIGKTEKIVPAPAALAKDEIAKAPESISNLVTRTESPPTTSARTEGGGSEAGSGNLFGKGDVGLVPGIGTAGGGGGTAAAGWGRGSGASGLPAHTVFRTNREAKPIQIVRATYPVMALRAGLESDVTLKIEVDPEGKVTKAEIVKSGGGGFDEEALKAVKQSRFEPAQREGQNVPAEFTFVYRFRLQR
jgi:TonB family protein